MKSTVQLAIMILCFLGLVSLSLAAQAKADDELRIGLYLSANRGASGSPHLTAADSDARNMRALLESRGGFQPAKSRTLGFDLVTTGKKAALQAAFEAIDSSIRAYRSQSPTGRVFFLLYYSGHGYSNQASKAQSGLQLGDERCDYATLESLVDQLDVQMSFLIYDTCYSGNALIAKNTPEKRSIEPAKGRIILSSSAAQEESFEYSSNIARGGVFTSLLKAGLEGGADANRNGLVDCFELLNYLYSAPSMGHIGSGLQLFTFGPVVLCRVRPDLSYLSNLPKMILEHASVVQGQDGSRQFPPRGGLPRIMGGEELAELVAKNGLSDTEQTALAAAYGIDALANPAIGIFSTEGLDAGQLETIRRLQASQVVPLVLPPGSYSVYCLVDGVNYSASLMVVTDQAATFSPFLPVGQGLVDWRSELSDIKQAMPGKRILTLATVLVPGLLLGIGAGFEVQAASLYQDYRQSLVSSIAGDLYAKTQEAALWRDRFYTGGLISLALPLGLILGNEWYYGDQTASLEAKLAALPPGVP